jgi:GNAT superfamily N-acetyltransferase
MMFSTMSLSPSTEIFVRHALPVDAEGVQRLYDVLVSNQDIQVLPDAIAGLSEDKAALFVCTSNSTVIATALVNICTDVMFGKQPFAVVENVIVDPLWQGMLIGTKLFAHIEEFCRVRSCSKIMLLSSAARENAHRFFIRAGYDSLAKRGFVKYRRKFSLPA